MQLPYLIMIEIPSAQSRRGALAALRLIARTQSVDGLGEFVRHIQELPPEPPGDESPPGPSWEQQTKPHK